MIARSARSFKPGKSDSMAAQFNLAGQIMRGSFFPVALIVVGLGWLLHEINIVPQANWIVILGLCSAGVAVLLIEGCNQSSIVKGPLLIAAGIAVFLRQQQNLPWGMLIPALLILWGVLLLIARLPAVPPAAKRWKKYRKSGHSVWEQD